MQWITSLNHRLVKPNWPEIYPGSDPNWIRCCQAPPSLSHMFWTCLKLYTVWSEKINTFSCIYERKVDPHPVTATFGVAPSNNRISRHQSDLMTLSTLLGRKLSRFYWKSHTSPSHLRWIYEIMSFLKLEKNQMYSSGLFERINTPF